MEADATLPLNCNSCARWTQIDIKNYNSIIFNTLQKFSGLKVSKINVVKIHTVRQYLTVAKYNIAFYASKKGLYPSDTSPFFMEPSSGFEPPT
ncbi:MAG: hypothetical protein OXI94_00205, partial [Gemmatimonadota bacterium]|nr:hypothetical protein [Gemmatimonadota bacterium]